MATLGRRLAASAAAAQSGSAAEVDRLAQAQAELARREAHLQQEVGRIFLFCSFAAAKLHTLSFPPLLEASCRCAFKCACLFVAPAGSA